MKNISIVVPLYNEEGNVLELHREIKDVCERNNYCYEIIFVDDGSKDRTFELAKELKPLKYIRFRRNFGQTAAMDAGIKQAKYEYVITMDGDRQNDPEDIPRLIKHIEDSNVDIVSGWRRKRKDPFMKKFFSRTANLLRKILINDGIHDSGCSLKIYRKECFDNINLYGEMHRFIPALLKIKGFTIGEVEVNHRPRVAGETKYNWRRAFKGFVDMIAVWFWNKYAVRPLHLLGTLGILFCLFGGVTSVLTLIEFFRGQSLSDTVLPLLTVFLIVTGIQLIISGLMADIISRSYHEAKKDSSYNVKEYFDNN